MALILSINKTPKVFRSSEYSWALDYDFNHFHYRLPDEDSPEVYEPLLDEVSLSELSYLLPLVLDLELLLQKQAIEGEYATRGV